LKELKIVFGNYNLTDNKYSEDFSKILAKAIAEKLAQKYDRIKYEKCG